MGLIKYNLGQLLELTTETNSRLEYGPNDVRGMTIEKQIIPTKADVSNTDLSKFLIVYPQEFVFNPRTHGKRIGFGFNDTTEAFIISWNNISFRVKPDMRTVIIPEYLFLHFNRTEWDREACYRSWGSSTEVFSWNALCEMMVDIPPIQIQKKYVSVYKGLLFNQQIYEQALEDLKLLIDSTLDQYKHSALKVEIGKLLEEIDIRNTKCKYNEVQGLNINKQFMPSIASSENLRNYKIVQKGQFAYSGMQTGRDKCIRIALSKHAEPIIVSPAYSVLQIKSELVVPEYIMMWFSRKESDRLGWFLSDSSIRANLDLSCFFEIEIPLPDISIQNSLVNIYNAYLLRKDINERLKAQIRNICPILIKGSLEEGMRE